MNRSQANGVNGEGARGEAVDVGKGSALGRVVSVGEHGVADGALHPWNVQTAVGHSECSAVSPAGGPRVAYDC